MENQLNTETVEKTPEQLETEMHQTREALTEKVAALENQVLGTVQTAANTFSNTVDAVKSFVDAAPSTVSETVENVTSAVREKMNEAFDVSGCIQRNPWSAVGTSFLGGFIAGSLLLRERKSSNESTSARPAEAPLHPHPFSSTASERGPGLFDELIGLVGKKLREMAETAIESASVSLNKNIREGIPKMVDEASKRLNFEDRNISEQSFDAANRIYGR
jgi:ElaB/YqjD/DUF883 family membrane-anchored ribosome-binding protein